jgi:hypothetical protein
VVDWILIELRETPGVASTATAPTMVARQAALLLKNGDIVGTDGISNLIFGFVPTDNLYAVLWHRNHCSIMSAIPLTIGGGIYSYDFSSSSGKVYGGISGHKLLAASVWGMFAADGDKSQFIDLSDITGPWTTDAGNQGYYYGDFDVNSHVNNFDKNDVWLPNDGKGSQVP